MIYIEENIEDDIEYRIRLIDKESAIKIKSKYAKTFTGEFAEVLTFDDGSIYIGTGDREKDILFYQELGAVIADVLEKYKLKSAELEIDTAQSYEDIKNLAFGYFLGLGDAYTYKSEKISYEEKDLYIKLSDAIKDNIDKEKMNTLISEMKILASSVQKARDFVNTPANLLTPYLFIEEIKNYLKDTDIEIEVISREEMKKQGLNLILAVGDSSANEPYLAILKYNKVMGDKYLAFVGKGVCCDTGGYCIKPASSMLGIKGDMAGAAAVVGAMKTIAESKININAVAILPICENRIAPGSYIPGDVFTSYSKKTVEVLNTDAEGRLILADALSYVIDKFKVEAVVDIATLTGAVVRMLGFSIAGTLSNNDEFYSVFESAYKASGERYLRIPYYKEHKDMLKSDIADIKNMGESYCGTITGGLFIESFAKDIPWIHMDIAGTASVDNAVFRFQKKGATGAGTSTLYYLAKEWEKRNRF